MSELQIPRSPTGENPREADSFYVKIRGWEFDTLVRAYERLGGEEDTLAPLDSPALSHNNGVAQLARAICRGDITAEEFEPIPAPKREENRFAKLNLALLPSEMNEVRERIALSGESEQWRNRRKDYKKLRQGVILPFCERVTEEQE